MSNTSIICPICGHEIDKSPCWACGQEVKEETMIYIKLKNDVVWSSDFDWKRKKGDILDCEIRNITGDILTRINGNLCLVEQKDILFDGETALGFLKHIEELRL